ncbi:MAG: hypothetical protein JSV19_02175 [Phycisphaerales bacterium]|nr:MAG: hypothetical protein JSV19_02175 [Phycisphaerales bacterium]
MVRRAWILLLVLVSARAEEPATTAPAARGDRPAPADAFWPSDELIEYRLKRAVDVVDQRYDLSDGQKQHLEQALLSRWPKFIHDNEEQLKSLLNEMIEARMATKPPDPDRVADWAGRALLMWEAVEQQIAAGDEEIKRILDEEQCERFDRDRERLRTRFGEFRETLAKWERGGFDPSTWPSLGRRDSAEREAGPHRSPEAHQPTTAPADTDEISAELDAWSRFVDEFCETYELDRMQRVTAHSILKEMQERAEAYRDRRRVEIEKLEHLINDQTPGNEDLVKRQAEELYGPIDEMFQELRRRLEALPTPAQVRRAGAADPTSQPADRTEPPPA